MTGDAANGASSVVVATDACFLRLIGSVASMPSSSTGAPVSSSVAGLGSIERSRSGIA